MFYSYVELEDQTQIAYSNVLANDCVEVSIERPVMLGFDSAMCILPAFEWKGVEGFSQEDLLYLDDFVHRNAPLILRLAREVSKEYA